MLTGLNNDPDVVAVVPTLGRDLPRLARCVSALRSQTTSARLAIVIVLNTPDDVVLNPVEVDGCTVLRPGLNLGWAGGLHLGRHAAAQAPRMWLVQDDMVPDPDCLGALLTALEVDPELAVVSPVVLDADGEVPRSSCGGVLRRDPVIDIDHWYPQEPTAVDQLDRHRLDALDYVPSRGMLVDLAAWDQVGGMFPGFYPVLWADVDFCTAVRAAGRRFALVTSAFARHDGQGSTPSVYGQFLFDRHRELFRRRWGSSAREAPMATTPLPAELALTIAAAAASLASDLATDRTRLIVGQAPLVAENAALRHDLTALHASSSWRVTAPLRALSRIVRRR